MRITLSSSVVLSKSIFWGDGHDFTPNGYTEWAYSRDLNLIKRNPAAKKNNTTT